MEGPPSTKAETSNNEGQKLLVIKKSKLQKFDKLVFNNKEKTSSEADERFIKEINKINDSNLSIDQSRTAIELDDDAFKHGKKKETIKFSLIDLEQLGLLGNGASANVYLLKHKQKNKFLALKVIPFKNEEKLKNLVETEVKLLSECHCDYIIRCYASYYNAGSVNMVIEYMNKATLADVLKKVKVIPEHILGIITNQILRGLEYLQKEKLVVHRDIKPSNILLNSNGYAKISDFGISKILEDSKDILKTLIGTYIYMSPERIRGQNYGFNSDVWSVSMAILECATGRHPYIQMSGFGNVNDLWSLLYLIDSNSSPYLPAESFSQEFCDFIEVSLNKDPALRPNAEKLLSHPFVMKYENQHSVLATWLSQIN